jgi:hypothetical protein
MDGEEVLSFARKHWVALLPDIMPYSLYLSVIIVFFAISSQFRLPSINQPFFQLLVFLALISTAYVTHRFFVHVINYFLNVIIVTNYRIVEIKKTLFIKDIKESIDMKKIQDIQFQQDGLVKNMLKFGELQIILGNSENKVISQVPNPDYFFRLLNQIKAEFIFKTPEMQYQERLQRDLRTAPNPYEKPIIETSPDNLDVKR